MDRPASYLKEATRDLHQATEELACASRILDGSMSRETYGRLLAGNYLAYSRLDPLLAGAARRLGADEVLPLLTDHVSPLLRDLSLLGIQPGGQQGGEEPLPDYRCLRRLLGGLYVTLGAAFGARVILVCLRRNPRLDTAGRFHFFEAAAAQPPDRWRTLGKLLDEHLLSADARRVAARAARQTFSLFQTSYQTSALG